MQMCIVTETDVDENKNAESEDGGGDIGGREEIREETCISGKVKCVHICFDVRHWRKLDPVRRLKIIIICVMVHRS